MRVVINTCFGGFSLSREAERAYLKRKGKECFHYQNVRGPRGGIDFDKYERSTAGVQDEWGNHRCATRDLGDHPTQAELYADGIYFYGRDVERHDPDLVAVVEELGDRAAGSCAELKVVEIPDDIEYEIDEYDGREHITEKHRTWF